MRGNMKLEIKDFLKLAAKAWANATLNIQKFANAYVEAVGKFGDDAIEKFKVAYPMFGDREWRRLGLIGNGQLLPQFFFKSDFFVGKLLNLNGSMRFQKALVGASNDGKLRVDRGNGPENVTLADLTKKEEKALVLLLSEENEKLSPAELREKFRTLVAKINKSNTRHKAAWEIRSDANRRWVVRFNRACNMSLSDMKKATSGLKHWSGVGTPARPSDEILKEMVDAIVELEALRDEEWDFEERNGHRDSWSDETCDEHEQLLDDIHNARVKVRDLAREATGNMELEV